MQRPSLSWCPGACCCDVPAQWPSTAGPSGQDSSPCPCLQAHTTRTAGCCCRSCLMVTYLVVELVGADDAGHRLVADAPHAVPASQRVRPPPHHVIAYWPGPTCSTGARGADPACTAVPLSAPPPSGRRTCLMPSCSATMSAYAWCARVTGSPKEEPPLLAPISSRSSGQGSLQVSMGQRPSRVAAAAESSLGRPRKPCVYPTIQHPCICTSGGSCRL